MKKFFRKSLSIMLAAAMVISTFAIVGVQAQAAPQFNISEEKLKNELMNRKLVTTINKSSQTFVTKKNDLSYFKVTKKKYDKKSKSMTVKATARFNREVAMVQTKVTYKYIYKNGKWKLGKCSLGAGTLSDIFMNNTWEGIWINRGSYSELGPDSPAIRITVDNITKDRYASGTMDVFPSPTNPDAYSASCTWTGGYDLKSGMVSFGGDRDWTTKPSDNDPHSVPSFQAYVDLVNKCITSDSYDYYQLTAKIVK